MDETEFCASYDNVHWIIILDSNKPLLLKNLDNHKCITLVKSIRDGKKTILPILILYEIYILEKWEKENDLNGNILLATSLIKYFKNKLALYLLKHFKIYSQKS